MVKYSEDQLDGLFAALSDRTRRKVLASLGQGSRPVTELASAHDMSLPGFMKHLRVLEDAGLLERTKEGRVVRCTLHSEPMKEAASWIAQYEKFWTDKLDSLARSLSLSAGGTATMEEARLGERPALNLRRHYPVPPERLWRAWTDPQAVRQWWGPGPGHSVSLAELDVRVGGRFRIVFGGTEGKDHECAGVYREVVPNRRLVFTWTWPRSTPERESLVTIVFRAAREGTELDFRHERFLDEKVRNEHREGWSSCFDKLERFLQD